MNIEKLVLSVIMFGIGYLTAIGMNYSIWQRILLATGLFLVTLILMDLKRVSERVVGVCITYRKKIHLLALEALLIIVFTLYLFLSAGVVILIKHILYKGEIHNLLPNIYSCGIFCIVSGSTIWVALAIGLPSGINQEEIDRNIDAVRSSFHYLHPRFLITAAFRITVNLSKVILHAIVFVPIQWIHTSYMRAIVFWSSVCTIGNHLFGNTKEDAIFLGIGVFIGFLVRPFLLAFDIVKK